MSKYKRFAPLTTFENGFVVIERHKNTYGERWKETFEQKDGKLKLVKSEVVVDYDHPKRQTRRFRRHKKHNP